MKIVAGTSGYAFKEWKGSFYPADIKPDGMLAFYATRFPTVEINNTFYRMPRENVLLDWAAQVPEGFTFAIKASQRITHHVRLKTEFAADLLGFLLKNTAVLEDHLGPILFQLPPNMKKDLDRLSCPVVCTASWGYLRLHRFDYGEAALAEWARCVADQPWTEAYVYFKHDEGVGSGPPAVDAFVAAVSAQG